MNFVSVKRHYIANRAINPISMSNSNEAILVLREGEWGHIQKLSSTCQASYQHPDRTEMAEESKKLKSEWTNTLEVCQYIDLYLHATYPNIS